MKHLSHWIRLASWLLVFSLLATPLPQANPAWASPPQQDSAPPAASDAAPGQASAPQAESPQRESVVSTNRGPASIEAYRYNYEWTGTQPISDTTCSGVHQTITINVPNSFTVQNVRLGFNASHTRRSDIQLWLHSPGGATAQLLMGAYGSLYDNFDVLFNDTGYNVYNGNHDVAAPYFENGWTSQAAPLTTFAGVSASGNWVVEYCDASFADTGTVYRTALFFNATPDFYSSDINAPVAAARGSVITYTLTVSNSGDLDTSSTTVSNTLPAGVTYLPGSLRCTSGACSYDAGNRSIHWQGAVGMHPMQAVPPATAGIFTSPRPAPSRIPEDKKSPQAPAVLPVFPALPAGDAFTPATEKLQAAQPEGAAGEVIEQFPNSWSAGGGSLGIEYLPSAPGVVYVHELETTPNIYARWYMPPHDGYFSGALSSSNPGWPVTLNARTGVASDNSLLRLFTTDYHGDLSRWDNIVETDGSNIIQNAWETYGPSNDSADGTSIYGILDIAVIPGVTPRYFVSAIEDGSVVYEIQLAKLGQFVPNSWQTVKTCSVPGLGDNAGIDYDQEHGLLFHSDAASSKIVVTDLDCHPVSTFTCPSPSGFSSGIAYAEGHSEVWVTDKNSNQTTRCKTPSLPAIITYAVTVSSSASTCNTDLVSRAVINDPAALYPVLKTATTRVVNSAPMIAEGFEGISLPAGWESVDSDTHAPTWGISELQWGHNGLKSALHTYGSKGTMQDGWLITPAFTPTPLTDLTFWEMTGDTLWHYRHSVWICSGASCASPPTSYTKLQDMDAVDTWREQKISLGNYNGQSIRIAFRYEGDYADLWFLDDVVVADACPYVSIGPEASLSICRGGTASHTFEVRNVTLSADTIHLTWPGAVWPSSLSPTSVSLPAGGVANVNAVIHVPWSQEPVGLAAYTVSAGGAGSGLSGSSLIKVGSYGDCNLSSSWAAAFSANSQRSRAALAAVGSVLYLIGGESPTGAKYDTVEKIDTAAAIAWPWAILPNLMPVPANNVCAAVVGADVYVPGGVDGTGVTVTTLRVFHADTETWDVISTDPLPVAAWGGGCTSLGGKVYYYGGYGSTEIVTDANVYDPAAPAGSRWSSITSLPTGLWAVSSVVINGKIYAVSGNSSGGNDITDVVAYDPADNAWHNLTPLSVGRAGAAVFAAGDNLVVCGGGWNTYRKDCVTYDTLYGYSGSWQTLQQSLTIGRRSIAYAQTSNGLYAVTGFNGSFSAYAEKLAYGLCPHLFLSNMQKR